MTGAVPTPSTLDLGELDGPLLVFGGVDGNLDALEALLAQAAKKGIPFTRMIHTGSVAPFCSQPMAVAARLAEIGIATVKGTFELDVQLLLANGTADDLPDTSAQGWRSILEDGVPDDVAEWIASLPAEVLFTLNGYSFHVVHGTISSPERLQFASSPAPGFLTELAQSQADVVIAGRSGLPFTRLFPAGATAQAWHNPGSLGLPANDGTPRVWYSLIHALPDGLEFDHQPLTYDHRAAAARLRQGAEDNPIARSLESGLWPSLEEVPQGERSKRGVPLEARSVILGGSTPAEPEAAADDF